MSRGRAEKLVRKLHHVESFPLDRGAFRRDQEFVMARKVVRQVTERELLFRVQPRTRRQRHNYRDRASRRPPCAIGGRKDSRDPGEDSVSCFFVSHLLFWLACLFRSELACCVGSRFM